MTGRHSWADPVRDLRKTERACRHCDVVRVTRHDGPGRPWVEFWRKGERLDVAGTPPCERRSRPAVEK